MAAKDYEICTALFSAYVAKTSKRNPHIMTDDRREITEGEIMMLVDWWLDKGCGKEGKGLQFDSLLRKGKKVTLHFENA